jgi:hypothetical protein
MAQSRPRLPDGHDHLIACMQRTNHHTHDSGVCRGVAYKGMLAILTETLDAFDENMENINKTKLPSFPQLANNFQDSSGTRITAALDVITIFQYPQNFPNFFPSPRTPVTQNNIARYLLTVTSPTVRRSRRHCHDT